VRVVLFYHSLVSDWNHGNAHFLRGVASELIARGHEAVIYEPEDGWSRRNLIAECGENAVRRFEAAFPHLRSTTYRADALDLDRALDGADLVIVHEWNDPDLVGRIGAHRARSGRYRLLFHDTHHRAASDREALAACDFAHYDGVLAYGRVIRDLYLARGWASRAWTWHEAADTRVFRPCEAAEEGDVVWIGNWGDGERSKEIREYFIEPVRALGLRACVYGVRYPEEARRALAAAGIEYRGWLPNYEAPCVFARFCATLHIPRRPYVETLPGIPTIRVFEALACGVPLLCSPWDDAEHLFEPGVDFLVAPDGAAMERELKRLIADRRAAREMAAHGRRTVLARHTCAHRVDELLFIASELESGARAEVLA
jgi:spore maturation protein CgeB